MKWLKDLLIKKILVGLIIETLDKALKHLGKDGSKTIVGLMIVAIGELLKLLPETAPYVGPILEHLKTLPADVIVTSGVVYTFGVGVVHKIIKWVKAKLGTTA